MATYQGPNVSVTQTFELSPPAVAIEDLPSVVVGTAYDVYDKESLGMAPGLTSSTGSAGITSMLEFGVEKVVFDHTVVGKRGFEFYPPKAYVRTDSKDFEIEVEDIEFTENGVVLDIDDTYPLRVVEEGSSEAFVPYYTASPAGGVEISAADLQTVSIPGGSVVTAKIQKGQSVFIDTTKVGEVGTAPATENAVRLAAPYSGAVSGTTVIIGAATAALNLPDCFYDPNADFNADRVQIGDILEMNTNDLGEEILASIVSVINKNTLRLQTDAVDNNDILKLHSMDGATSTLASTFNVGSYKITRLIAFSKMIYEAATGRSIAEKVDATKLKVAKSGMSTAPSVGDWFTVSPTASQVSLHTHFYKVISVFDDGTNYVVGTDQSIYLDGGSTVFTGGVAERFNMWQNKVENEIVCDFRAVRTSEVGVAKRITSGQDITNAWSKDETIDVHNELAWMAATERAACGGRVIYGVHVDASDANIASQYADAFEALKIYDVYSHAIGSTDSGVNASVDAYLEQQSEPYQGHERIATLCYDQDNVYAQCEGTGNMATSGLITITSSPFDPVSAGVTVEDEVDIFDSDGVYVDTAEVVSTPDPLSPTTIQTDYEDESLTGHTFKFKSGRPADQAIKIGAIKYGSRRVKTIWPGYFYAYVGGERLLLPPYYITADIAGRDSRVIVSQSFTNASFAPYGMSNMELGTNFHFKKSELDTIGAGGIDIMIQDQSVSQTIKSRHDLTSNMDAVEYREHSITKQADVAAKTYRSAVAPYIGKYNITDDLLRFIGTVCNIVSQNLTKNPGIVRDAKVDSIKRDEVITDKINIYVTVTVFVAGNYYDIELLVKSR